MTGASDAVPEPASQDLTAGGAASPGSTARPDPRPRSTSRRPPDRALERELLATHRLVGGMDEVGRGSLAGPVSVGLAVVSRATPDAFPAGLADSKLLSPRRREALVGPCRSWLADHAVAHASNEEIDAIGIVGALRLAGRRALAQVGARGNLPGVVVLDGVSDWLSEPAADLLTALEPPAGAGWAGRAGPSGNGTGADRTDRSDPGVPDAVRAWRAGASPPVVMRVKADATCAVVAAASVLAKVERDALMRALPDPGYDWVHNKGYASPAHVEGLRRLGPSRRHRRTWHLPGLD